MMLTPSDNHHEKQCNSKIGEYRWVASHWNWSRYIRIFLGRESELAKLLAQDWRWPDRACAEVGRSALGTTMPEQELASRFYCSVTLSSCTTLCQREAIFNTSICVETTIFWFCTKIEGIACDRLVRNFAKGGGIMLVVSEVRKSSMVIMQIATRA